MTRARVAVALTAVSLVVAVSPALAQGDVPHWRKNHATLAVGLNIAGSYPIGAGAAELRANAPGTPPPIALFEADSTFQRVSGFEARIAFAFTSRLAVEVGGVYAKPNLDVAITQDREADPLTITDVTTRYTVDVSGVWQIPYFRVGPGGRAFVLGGGGSLWEMQEDRLLVERGSFVHGGGGLQYWFRGGDARRRPLGARADVRVIRRTGGIEFEGAARTYAVFSALAFVGF